MRRMLGQSSVLPYEVTHGIGANSPKSYHLTAINGTVGTPGGEVLWDLAEAV